MRGMVWQSCLGMASPGRAGYCWAMRVLGKAVGVRLGKVLSGIVWHGGLGSVSVRQSCLGTFRCGAVKFGEARQSGQVRDGLVVDRCVMFWRGSQGDASSGTVMSGAEWSGSQGFAGHVTVERGEAGQSTVGQGSRGLVRRGEL